MRDLRELEHYRQRGATVAEFYGWEGDATCGAFTVPSVVDRQPLFVVASSDEGWDHVSVSRRTRCPNWIEMEQVKRLFFRDDETAMQLHVPPAEHVNAHAYCLHLWRPLDQEIPRPPAIFVGLMTDKPLKSRLEALAMRKKAEASIRPPP